MKTYTPLILFAFMIHLTAFSQQTFQQADVSYTGNAIHLEYRPTQSALSSVTIEGKEFLSIGGFFDDSKPGARAIPSELLTIAIPPGSNPRLNIRNVDYQQRTHLAPMPNPSARIVGDTAYDYTFTSRVSTPAEIRPAAEITGFGWVRDYYCVYVQVNTYRFEESTSELSVLTNLAFDLSFPGGLQQPLMKASSSSSDILADRLVVNSTSASGWKARPPVPESVAASGDWIDFSKTYVKVRVGQDGIYRITGANLEQWGATLGSIVPSTLKLYESGEEVPIHVQSSGAFGSGDFVEFYGHRNYTNELYRTQTARDTDYVNYLNRYSDSTTYWLTWGGTDGQRIPDYSLQAPADTVQSYRHLERIENDYYIFVGDAENPSTQFPNWANKHWAMFDIKINLDPRKFHYQMPVSDFVPGTSARALCKFQSNAFIPGFSPAHMAAIYVNDSQEPVDSMGINELEIGLLDGTFSSDILTNGTTKISIENRPTQASYSVINGDWIELEYNRYLIPDNDRITFRIDDNVAPAGNKTVLLKGFTTENVVVYKTTPEYRRYTSLQSADLNGAKSIWFGDAFSGNDQYSASSVDSVLTPAFLALRAPGQNPFADLRATTNNADYIIVTNPMLLSSAQQYADFIATEYSVATRVVTIDNIADEFSYGQVQPEGIRDFLQYAYTNWQRPGPQYVLFLGDASYDYKDIARKLDPNLLKLERNQNLVPTIGFPVGDAKMVMWDESDRRAVPQMAIGRIPAISNADVLQYLERHRAYRDADYSEWNKRYLLFTGGKESLPLQIDQLFKANQGIIDESIRPAPVRGGYDHFYKTVNPLTQYGPYDATYFDNSVSNGAVLISYLGHSGTQTWDNGISRPIQLQNDVDKYSVISDFGCSTGKFAETNVISFSELFTLGPTSNAMAYVGNSSLGQIGIAQTLSRYFYEAILKDTVHTLGLAHTLSKQKLAARLATTDINRIAIRTNSLVGDPIMEVAVPTKPNFLVNENEVIPLDTRLTEVNDSARFMMIARNHGSAIEPMLEYRVYHTNNDTLVGDNVYSIPSPGYKDTVFFTLPVKDLKGIHRFTVTLDPNNQFEELSEVDNEASAQFTVTASSAIVLGGISSAAVYNNEIVVLNPVFPPPGNANTLLTEISNSPTFDAGTTVSRPVQFGEVTTHVPITDFSPNQRYYFRYRIDPTENWTGPYTFFRLEEDAKQAFIDSVSLSDASRNFYLNIGEIISQRREVEISLASANFTAGKYAIVSINGQNIVQGEELSGYYMTVLDGMTKERKSELVGYGPTRTPNFIDTTIQFLDSIAQGDILLVAIADIGTTAQTIWPVLADAFKQFGSVLIDGLRPGDEWCMIGVKGGAPGTANERFVPFDSVKVPALLDTTMYIQNSTMQFFSEPFGPAGKWKSLRKSLSGGTVSASVAGITSSLGVDTLQSMIPDAVQDLSGIDAETYPNIALAAQIQADQQGVPPRNLKVTLAYDLPAELAVNYQTVAMPNTEVPKGVAAEATARIYNVGELAAANVKAEFFFLTPDNQKLPLKDITIPELLPGAYHDEMLSITTADYTGKAAFIVELDNGGTVREQQRSNNTYSVPFTILGDTTRPTLDVTIDGILPYDGDYVRSHPVVVVKLFDNSPLPIEDASSFLVYLNDTLVVDNPGYDVTFQPGTGEEKGTLTLKPILEDGTHFFRFNALDESGNKAFAEDMEVMVIVESDAQLFDLYNVPNPFAEKTSFTFTLTGSLVPQEMEIKVFTIAGRLIRDIIVPPSQLRIGYNNIPWDGRDEDGDQLANGTYLYKVSYTMDSGKQYIIGKLAVLR